MKVIENMSLNINVEAKVEGESARVVSFVDMVPAQANRILDTMTQNAPKYTKDLKPFFICASNGA